MKTAIQRMEADGIKITPALRYHIDQIQLDAMKEGMRRAATHTYNYVYADYNVAVGIEKDILTAAEQLTEKDL